MGGNCEAYSAFMSRTCLDCGRGYDKCREQGCKGAEYRDYELGVLTAATSKEAKKKRIETEIAELQSELENLESDEE